MEIQEGDIVFFKEKADGKIYDCGMVVLKNSKPHAMRLRAFLGQVVESLPSTQQGTYYEIYRFVGPRDHLEPDAKVIAEAAQWFKKWRFHRFSTYFWIFLSRIPIIKHWIKCTEDTAKVQANYGFITSTAIAWAYECAGVDLVPNRSPDLTSLGDLTRCALFRKIS